MGINNTCNIATLSSYPEQRQLYIALNQIVSGVGNLLGPMLGSLLYSLGGYSCPFFGIALIHALIILVYMFIIKIDFEDNLS